MAKNVKKADAKNNNDIIISKLLPETNESDTENETPSPDFHKSTKKTTPPESSVATNK